MIEVVGVVAALTDGGRKKTETAVVADASASVVGLWEDGAGQELAVKPARVLATHAVWLLAWRIGGSYAAPMLCQSWTSLAVSWQDIDLRQPVLRSRPEQVSRHPTSPHSQGFPSICLEQGAAGRQPGP